MLLTSGRATSLGVPPIAGVGCKADNTSNGCISFTGFARRVVLACCKFASLSSLGLPSLQLFIPMEDRRRRMLWITKLCSKISFSLPSNVFPRVHLSQLKLLLVRNQPTLLFRRNFQKFLKSFWSGSNHQSKVWLRDAESVAIGEFFPKSMSNGKSWKFRFCIEGKLSG